MRCLRAWCLPPALGLLSMSGLAEKPEPCLQGGKDGLSVNAAPRCVEAFRDQGLSDQFKATVERSVDRRPQTARERKGEEARSNLQHLMQKSAAETPPKKGYYGQQ
jgi:hypothetical protein